MSRINSLRRQPHSIFLIYLDYLNGLTLPSVGLSVKPSSKSGRDEHIIVSLCRACAQVYLTSNAGGPLHTILVLLLLVIHFKEHVTLRLVDSEFSYQLFWQMELNNYCGIKESNKELYKASGDIGTSKNPVNPVQDHLGHHVLVLYHIYKPALDPNIGY